MLPNTKNPLKLHRNPYRKTSAEIVSEAKSMLAGGKLFIFTLLSFFIFLSFVCLKII